MSSVSLNVRLRDRIAARAAELEAQLRSSRRPLRLIASTSLAELDVFIPIARFGGPAIPEAHFVEMAARLFATYAVPIPDELPWVRFVTPHGPDVWGLWIRVTTADCREVVGTLRETNATLPGAFAVDRTPLSA